MSRIFEYVAKNYRREIRVNEVASLLNMANNSFSRYFSQHTKKTFIEFVNEFRLNHACKLLVEDDTQSVSQICFDCGFNNISHFNTTFRKAYHKNPLAYRKEYLQQESTK